jgi:hypothetical protein
MDVSQKRIPISLFNELLPSSKLEDLALPYKLDSGNSVKLSGQLTFCTLLRGLLYDTDIALRAMAVKFEESTGESLHYSSIAKRLRSIKPDYFRDIFDYLTGVVGPQVNPKSPGPLSVIKVDATLVTISAKLCSFGLEHKSSTPGKDRKLVKSVFTLHDQMPGFLRLCENVEEHNDNKAIGDSITASCAAGQIWIFDKGCNSRDILKTIHDKKAFFVTRLGTQGVKTLRTVYSAEQSEMLIEVPGKGDPSYVIAHVEECVFANSSASETKKYADMRLAVIRGYRYDSRGKDKGWKPIVFMTNLPVSEDGTQIGPYSYAEVARLYYDRWEIETFFKKIKGHLSYDHLLSRSKNGIEIMIYMTLIAAMMMIWAKSITKIADGWKIVKFWLEVSCRDWIENLIESQHHLKRASCRAG